MQFKKFYLLKDGSGNNVKINNIPFVKYLIKFYNWLGFRVFYVGGKSK
jgi:hypothetical protein